MSEEPINETPNRESQLEAKLAEAIAEIHNCHTLLTILVAQRNGTAVLTDAEMQNAPQLGQLAVLRDDRIPGCVMLLRPRLAS